MSKAWEIMLYHSVEASFRQAATHQLDAKGKG